MIKYGYRIKVTKNILLVGMLVLFIAAGGPAPDLPAAGQDTEMSEKQKEAARLAEELGVEQKLKMQEQRISASGHCRKGIMFYKEDDLEKSAEEFNLALKLDPGNKTAREYLERIKTGLDKKAREQNKQLYAGAIALGKEGDYDNAVSKLELILTGKADYYKTEAEKYLEALEQKRAADDKSKAVNANAQSRKKNEQEVETHLDRGKEHYAAGRFDQAVAEWEKIMALTNPGDFDYKIAQILIQRARNKQLNKEEDRLVLEKKISEKTMASEIKKRWVVSKEDNDHKASAVETEVQAPLESKERIIELSKQTVSIDFDKKHLRDVLDYLDSITGVNLVLDDTIFPRTGAEAPAAGTASPYVTIHLKDIPLIEVLDVILRTKGLKYRIEENLIWVTTPDILAQEIFVTEVFQLSSGTGKIQDILKEVIPQPQGSSINLDSRAGTLIVTNTPTNIELIRDIVLSLDIAPIQVSIQAKFIEIDNTFMEEFARGIVTTNGVNISENMSSKGQGDVSALGASFSGITSGEGLRLDYDKTTDTAFGFDLEALAVTGKIKVLSAPKVTTINNQEANIEITSTIPVVESYSIETEDVDVATNMTLKLSTMVPGDAVDRKTGILLKVIPSVGADRKTINLTLVPEVIELADWTTYNQGVRTPVFSTRRVNTQVIVNDGDTVILGGLSKEAETKYKNTIPVIGSIPVVNKMFGRDSKSDDTKSLLVFVTAQILTPAGETIR